MRGFVSNLTWWQFSSKLPPNFFMTKFSGKFSRIFDDKNGDKLSQKVSGEHGWLMFVIEFR